jgi:hypothetical protein
MKKFVQKIEAIFERARCLLILAGLLQQPELHPVSVRAVWPVRRTRLLGKFR